MKIVLPYDIHRKIMFYVNNCDKEIGGMGRIKFDKNKSEYRVTSVYLPKQEVGSAHTDLDADSVAQCEINSINDEGWYNFWWHSHVNMQAFWSGTDNATIKEMGKQGLCVAVVFNKRKECRGAVYARSNEDHIPDFFNDNVSVEWVDEPLLNSDILLQEIKDNVREKTWTNKHVHSGIDYSYLDKDYKGTSTFMYDEFDPTLSIREYTGTSRAYAEPVRNALKQCKKEKVDAICFKWGNISLTFGALLELNRGEVQDIIDSNPHMPPDKKIELMSIWYYIPYNTKFNFTHKPVESMSLMAGME